MRSTIVPREGPARDDVLPAGRGWRSPASAQVRDLPSRTRHRDARACAERPEVDPFRSRSRPADTGLDPPRALRRTPRATARGRAARPAGARSPDAPGPVAVAAAAPSGPERRAGSDGASRTETP